MKTYEAVVIFASDESQHLAGREFLKKEFEGAGITIKKEEDMGTGSWPTRSARTTGDATSSTSSRARPNPSRRSTRR